MFSILGLGAVAIDHLIYVESFPPPNAKSQVLRSEQQCGGLTATALVAASRLGVRCAYAGALGDDEGSRFVEEVMQGEGIDLSHIVHRAGAAPVRSVIVVGLQGATRNVFPEHPMITGADPHLPDEAIIRAARVLFVDHLGIEGMIRAAKIARESGIPVVSDVERDDSPRFAELLGLVDHVVMSWEFAHELTGAETPDDAVRGLWNPSRSVVAVTHGEDGCWFSEDGETVLHQPAFKVQAVDTTGCGDVFHGAYCAALAKGLSPAERIRFASAAAALKATQRGGQAGAPRLEAVERLLGSEPNGQNS
jgi:sugar/nucleoside kinase (ribokinase family)